MPWSLDRCSAGRRHGEERLAEAFGTRFVEQDRASLTVSTPTPNVGTRHLDGNEKWLDRGLGEEHQDVGRTEEHEARAPRRAAAKGAYAPGDARLTARSTWAKPGSPQGVLRVTDGNEVRKRPSSAVAIGQPMTSA